MGSILRPSATANPPELRFDLRVRPQSAELPWHAELLAEGGERLDFMTPLNLLRYLAQLGSSLPPGGGLR